jgi:hypothetical protein
MKNMNMELYIDKKYMSVYSQFRFDKSQIRLLHFDSKQVSGLKIRVLKNDKHFTLFIHVSSPQYNSEFICRKINISNDTEKTLKEKIYSQNIKANITKHVMDIMEHNELFEKIYLKLIDNVYSMYINKYGV